MKYIKFPLLILLGVCTMSCFTTTYEFRRVDQSALFSRDFNPDIMNKLKRGVYLIYDDSCKCFLSGKAFFLYSDGRVESTNFSQDSIGLGYITPQNLSELINGDCFRLNKHYQSPYGNDDGIYVVKNDTLYIDLYNIVGIKRWALYKSHLLIRDSVTVCPILCDKQIQTRYFFKCIPYPIPYTLPPRSAKNQKWMWKNEEDWKAYKKARDEYKKSLWQQTQTP